MRQAAMILERILTWACWILRHVFTEIDRIELSPANQIKPRAILSTLLCYSSDFWIKPWCHQIHFGEPQLQTLVTRDAELAKVFFAAPASLCRGGAARADYGTFWGSNWAP